MKKDKAHKQKPGSQAGMTKANEIEQIVLAMLHETIYNITSTYMDALWLDIDRERERITWRAQDENGIWYNGRCKLELTAFQSPGQ